MGLLSVKIPRSSSLSWKYSIFGLRKNKQNSKQVQYQRHHLCTLGATKGASRRVIIFSNITSNWASLTKLCVAWISNLRKPRVHLDNASDSSHWIGLRENWNRNPLMFDGETEKPIGFLMFPVDFPFNQSTESKQISRVIDMPCRLAHARHVSLHMP